MISLGAPLWLSLRWIPSPSELWKQKYMFILKPGHPECCREANPSPQADFQTSCPCWAHLQKQPLLHVAVNLEGDISNLVEKVGTK